MVGVIVSCLSYAWKSSQQIEIKTNNINEGEIFPKEDVSYSLHGTLFFGSVEKFKDITQASRFNQKDVIFDCEDLHIVDSSALESIDSQTAKYHKLGKTLHLKNIDKESLKLIDRAKPLLDINLSSK